MSTRIAMAIAAAATLTGTGCWSMGNALGIYRDYDLKPKSNADCDHMETADGDRCRWFVRANDALKAKDLTRARRAVGQMSYVRPDGAAESMWEEALGREVADAIDRKKRAISLIPNRVESLALHVDNATTDNDGGWLACPGARLKIRADVTVEGGEVVETWVKRTEKGGYVDYGAFAFEIVGGTFDAARGEVKVSEDALVGYRGGVQVTASVRGKPHVRQSLRIRLKTAESCGTIPAHGARPCADGRPVGVHFAAKAGSNGVDGRGGRGFFGGLGKAQGEDGGRGGPGLPAENGAVGPPTEFRIGIAAAGDGMRSGEVIAMQAIHLLENTTTWHFFDRKALPCDTLHLVVAGGDGGRGGDGGDGGDGQASALDDHSGQGGDGGAAGDGGDGGMGGEIRILYDADHEELKEIVRGLTPGGEGGPPGQPGASGSAGGPTSEKITTIDGRYGMKGRRGVNGSTPQVRSSPAKRLFVDPPPELKLR